MCTVLFIIHKSTLTFALNIEFGRLLVGVFALYIDSLCNFFPPLLRASGLRKTICEMQLANSDFESVMSKYM